mmetsp:Transcript_79459/g.177971  ORF Transcript_79459/g.177971 Transcript_79459/m.177971 type:complete len:509 (-) Transcript_79459:81-1607(-)
MGAMSKVLEESMKGVKPEMEKSVAHRPLPPVPKGLRGPDRQGKPPISLVLFYQYIEPAWTTKQHKAALSFVNDLGRKHSVTGRGRCATEGLNCTLTGTAENLRAFCQGLRDWDPTFNETDFKFTDGLDWHKRFKSLTLQKKQELVAYGLPVEAAPSLKDNGTQHLEATEYHKLMSEPNTVIIDVRNRYESELGHFQPPPGGAEFIDPMVRNSHELPKWLATPEVQEKLQGKKVMMYCTGGIRCERFSALLSQIKKEQPEFKTEGEFMVRGGIERYMRTFPEGGFWKGRNYLFDKRQEQMPEKKPESKIEAEMETVCCVCKTPWGWYRGGFKCIKQDCQVPVIVCSECKEVAPEKMQCPLCEKGFSLRCLAAPELREAEKRKAEAKAAMGEREAKRRAKHGGKDPSKRIFVGSIPLVIDASTLKEALGGGVKMIHWIADRTTGLFYGSAFVQMESKAEAKRVVQSAQEGLRLGKRKLRVNFAPPNEGEEWPPPDFVQLERPQVPVCPGR